MWCHGRSRHIRDPPELSPHTDPLRDSVCNTKYPRAQTFLQKFHPQLNPIERVWAQLKRFTKVHCKYSFPSLRKNIPLVYDSVTVENIRHHFRKVRHYMFCYLRHHFRKVHHYMFCYLSVLLQERNLIRHC